MEPATATSGPTDAGTMGKAEPTADTGLGPIARHVRVVLRLFSELIGPASHSPDYPFSTQQFLPLLENELTRFKMWVGNLGAHQAGRASLDYRLREASHLQEQVVYLLRDASESLRDALAAAQPQSANTAGGADQQLSDCGRDGASEGSFTDSEGDEPALEARLSTLCTDVREVVDCLLRLSVAIANPAPHERFRKFGAVDISYREPHDIAYVRDKFPKVSQEMAGMLGKAITRRRQFFRYRQAHHEKLSANLETAGAVGDADDNRTEIFPKTVASTLPDDVKDIPNLDLRHNVIDEDNRSDAEASMTSYATSAGFPAEMRDGEYIIPPPPLRVPPLPKEAELGSFECSFCYRIIAASTRAAWKRHVFGDLRPYTCLFGNCLDSNADFDRRGRWQAHISQHHWKSWSCPFQCGGTYSSVSDLKAHLNHQHLPNAPLIQLETLAALGESPASEDTKADCPICSHPTKGLRQYSRHVGRHLEQLALFALPSLDQPNENSSEEYEADSDRSVAETDAEELPPRSASPELDISDGGDRFVTTLEEIYAVRKEHEQRSNDGDANVEFDLNPPDPDPEMHSPVTNRPEVKTSKQDRRPYIASVEDADDFDSPIQGTARYTGSVYTSTVASPTKEKPNTRRARREKWRDPFGPLTDSDSTVHLQADLAKRSIEAEEPHLAFASADSETTEPRQELIPEGELRDKPTQQRHSTQRRGSRSSRPSPPRQPPNEDRICNVGGCKKKHCYVKFDDTKIYSRYCFGHTCSRTVSIEDGFHCSIPKSKGDKYCPDHMTCGADGCREIGWYADDTFPWFCPDHRCSRTGCLAGADDRIFKRCKQHQKYTDL